MASNDCVSCRTVCVLVHHEGHFPNVLLCAIAGKFPHGVCTWVYRARTVSYNERASIDSLIGTPRRKSHDCSWLDLREPHQGHTFVDRQASACAIIARFAAFFRIQTRSRIFRDLCHVSDYLAAVSVFYDVRRFRKLIEIKQRTQIDSFLDECAVIDGLL